MATPQYALPVGSLILVTGANGYIASHVVDVLLALKFRVRGTVRKDNPWFNQFFENRYGKGVFETVVVPSMQDAGDFDAAMCGIDGVVHVVGALQMHRHILRGFD